MAPPPVFPCDLPSCSHPPEGDAVEARIPGNGLQPGIVNADRLTAENTRVGESHLMGGGGIYRFRGEGHQGGVFKYYTYTETHK